VSSFRLVSLVCAGLALASALFAGLLIEGKKVKLVGSAGSDDRVGAKVLGER